MTHDVSAHHPNNLENIAPLLLGSVGEVATSELPPLPCPRVVRRASKPAQNSMVRLAVLNALRPSSYGVRF